MYKASISPSYNIKSRLARSEWLRSNKSAKQTRGAQRSQYPTLLCKQRQCGVFLPNQRAPTAGPTTGSVSDVLSAVSRCLAFTPIVSEVPSNQELCALGLAAVNLQLILVAPTSAVTPLGSAGPLMPWVVCCRRGRVVSAEECCQFEQQRRGIYRSGVNSTIFALDIAEMGWLTNPGL